MLTKNIELNDQFQKALSLLEEGSKNIFITGKAGTGKSTLLDYFRNHTKKKVVVLAPTGVAALNVRGQTIHSFFKFKPDITYDAVKKISKSNPNSVYKKMDVLIIDEISMVRADLLDCVDKFLRLNGKNTDLPFGGIQIIFIGDLYQLPPVITGQEKQIFTSFYNSGYFFDAKVFQQFEMEFIELEKIYRQTDQHFINLLNAIRNNSISDEQLNLLNQRLNSEFESSANDFYIYLTTTNRMADEVNNKKLNQLKTKSHYYQSQINGQFDQKYLPTEVNLNLKVGAQIMFVNNDSCHQWVNGTIGKVVEITKDEDYNDELLIVELPNGKEVEVTPFTWEIFNFSFNTQTNSLQSETVGTFTQYPIRLAWAVTIHKSQGKTFDKVIVDIGSGTFAHGQMYVALSRCTSLEGLVLKKPISKKHIFMDWRVVKFMTQYQWKISDQKLSLTGKLELINQAIKDRQSLEIVYLKSSDEKSRRVIKPKILGEMEYKDKSFLGVGGFDLKRGEERNFRVDRILELKILH